MTLRIPSFLLALSLMLAAASTRAAEAPDDLLQYIDLKPSFVLNVQSPGGKMRFAKVDASVKVLTRSAAALVEQHMPYIRNIMVMLLTATPADQLRSVEGREAVRKEALKRVQAFFKKEENRPVVDDLLFTSFVVQ
ncbi:flagellar basal body-associated FliL family protein [Hahella sp. SMD15-11]|uniref:Flagellar protein FliL n=1 Tax=Thermohahella caldifontis TaxID=3142973 RepID=A0AB39USR4_9GAMM